MGTTYLEKFVPQTLGASSFEVRITGHFTHPGVFTNKTIILILSVTVTIGFGFADK